MDLRKTLAGAAVAIVGTVIGFYFGGHTAEPAAAGAAAAAQGRRHGAINAQWQQIRGEWDLAMRHRQLLARDQRGISGDWTGC